MSERFHLDHAYLMDVSLPRIKPFVEHHPKDFDYLSNIAPQLRARVDELLPNTRPEYGACHRDTHPWNIPFQDDNSPTLFDFDCFGHGWRVYDVAIVGATLAQFEWSRKARTNRTRRRNLAIKGYEKTRTLTDAEHVTLTVFPSVCFIWAMGVHAALAPRHGGSWLDDGYLDDFMDFIRSWIKHSKVL
jgi:Ser/Thr protein kinase RdoA (MazF antagonist)